MATLLWLCQRVILRPRGAGARKQDNMHPFKFAPCRRGRHIIYPQQTATNRMAICILTTVSSPALDFGAALTYPFLQDKHRFLNGPRSGPGCVQPPPYTTQYTQAHAHTQRARTHWQLTARKNKKEKTQGPRPNHVNEQIHARAQAGSHWRERVQCAGPGWHAACVRGVRMCGAGLLCAGCEGAVLACVWDAGEKDWC